MSKRDEKMAQSNRQANKSKKTISREEKAARIKAAEERERHERERRERSEKVKKIFTVIVCVILVLALGIPTMALTVLSQ